MARVVEHKEGFAVEKVICNYCGVENWVKYSTICSDSSKVDEFDALCCWRCEGLSWTSEELKRIWEDEGGENAINEVQIGILDGKSSNPLG